MYPFVAQTKLFATCLLAPLIVSLATLVFFPQWVRRSCPTTLPRGAGAAGLGLATSSHVSSRPSNLAVGAASGLASNATQGKGAATSSTTSPASSAAATTTIQVAATPRPSPGTTARTTTSAASTSTTTQAIASTTTSLPPGGPTSPAERFASLAKVLTLVNPNVPAAGGDAGTYDGCHAAGHGVFWAYLAGQIRSFGLHAHNFRSFLQQSNPCWFVVIYTREEITGRFDPSRPWSENTDRVLDSWVSQGITVRRIIEEATKVLHPAGSNVAWLSVDRKERSNEQHRAVTLIGREVAKVHGIPRSESDIVAVSRPDVAISHAVSVPRIVAATARVPHFVLLPHHDARVGGNDPSEMLVFATRRFWEATCAFEPGEVDREPLKGRLTPVGEGCLATTTTCGYFAGHFIHAAHALGIVPFFYFGPIKLHLHRITGSFNIGVMRPVGHILPTPDSEVQGVMDVTRMAKCVVGDVTACVNRGRARELAPPQSRCWGPTVWVQINPGDAGLWLCRDQADVDIAC